MNKDSNQKYQFVWEKWHSPAEEYQQSLLYGSDSKDIIKEIDEDELAELIESGEYEEIQHKIPIIPILPSMIEHNKFLESFDIWILHTNFDIDDGVQAIIAATGGVESLQVVTRYRVKLGFTKAGLFNNSEVKQSIQTNLLSHLSRSNSPELSHNSTADIFPFDSEFQKKIENKKKDLDQTGYPWSIFVFPNGNLSVSQHESTDEMVDNVQFLSQMKLVIGGYILCSDETMGYNT